MSYDERKAKVMQTLIESIREDVELLGRLLDEQRREMHTESVTSSTSSADRRH